MLPERGGRPMGAFRWSVCAVLSARRLRAVPAPTEQILGNAALRDATVHLQHRIVLSAPVEPGSDCTRSWGDLFNQMDFDTDQVLVEDEPLRFFTGAYSEKDPVPLMEELFSEADDDRDGKITHAEFMALALLDEIKAEANKAQCDPMADLVATAYPKVSSLEERTPVHSASAPVSGGQCPDGYNATEGEVSGQDQFGRGNLDLQDSIDSCAAECSARAACLSFEYSAQKKICQLNKVYQRTSNASKEDFTLCQRDPCPQGFHYRPGDIPGFDQYARPNNTAETVEKCARDCEMQASCNSFEWSPSTKVCNLNKEFKPRQGEIGDYRFCSRDRAGPSKRTECGAWTCNQIKSEANCTNSEAACGLKCAGWGGSWCLSDGAKCTDFTTKQLCSSALKVNKDLTCWWIDKPSGEGECLDKNV